jgi:hypothetical protein
VSPSFAFLFLLAAAFLEASTFAKAIAPRQVAAPSQAPSNQSPTQLTPPADPASSHFTTDAGVLLVTIKPTALADYELTIRTLQEALSKDTDATRGQAAKGWRVFRAAETDAKGNFVFVHVMLPAVPNFDYRPSLLIDELVKELAPDLLIKYQDAFAAPPTKLSLTEFAQMSVAPVETKKPLR